ncbi:hypothetical protein WAE58_21695 [Pedobacter panaciterrae]|uniref:Uncharacterized protein n=1 Tax=Pedobacter panaciterrae TaxID=363849 RepID=A0ABU8NS33_9SPHI
MTITKAKKHVASNYGYANWTDAISDQETEVCEMMNYEAEVLVQLNQINTGRLDYLYSVNVGRAFIIGLIITLLLLTLSIKAVQVCNEPTKQEVDAYQFNRKSIGQ